jgi:uncharacterized protein YjbI with pentapeptide repeats
MFATKLAAKECRVLLIPLHLVDPRDDIEKIVGGFAQDNVGLPDNPLDPKKGAKRLLLLFDGLDELSESGKTGTDLARAFLESAEKYVHRKNHEGLRLQILVSGREVAVQQGSNLFRRPGQVLTVIPYHVPESAQKEQKMVDPKGLLTEDQRDGWWQAFGAATGQTFAEMPPKLRRRDLDDVTAQPLLGFLVAKNYLTNTVDFSQRVNRNKIYESLLGGVYERAYADHVTHPTTRAFERKDFDHALEEIAIATWHGNGRTATVSEIAGRMEQEGKWKHFVNDCKGGRGDGIMQLLLAFYFRRAGRTAAHEHAFEFTHKSFSEYLVALRIVRLLKRMSVEIGRYEHDDGGWCQSEALRHWALVCGPKTLDFHIHRFFVDEVALVESAQALAWQQMLAKLIGEVLRNGMPMEKLSGGLTYMEQSRQARNAEEILLAALHACACVTQEKSRIDWPEKTSAGEWIGRLAGQTMGGTNRLAMWCLDFLDLHGCVLFGRDLHDAQLSWSDLSDADLSHAILDGAFLEGAILDRAFLFHASLKRTILEGAILEDAMLSHANFTGATLEGAILHRANLEGANFHSTILDSASLASANLDGATFSFATLMHTNFIGANLDSANFRCAQNMRQSRGLPQEIIDQFASDD